MPRTNQKVERFLTVFQGRQDVVPRYWKSKDGQRVGYTPLCLNDWKDGICEKPCRTCQNAEYISISDQLVRDHFRGRHVLGIYPLMPDNTCYFVAADFDDHHRDRDPLTDARAYYDVGQVNDFPISSLRSKSGNGYHAYIFFTGAVPAWKTRMVAFAMLQEAQIIGDDAEISSFDRLFPNQDKLSGRGFGNLIALPLQGQAARNGHTLFLDPATDFKKPYADQWEILSGIERVSEARLDALIKDWDLKRELESVPVSINAVNKTKEAQRLLDCEFVRWCQENAESVSEPLWYCLVSNLVRVKGGYTFAHEISRPYSKYTREETDNKIHQAMDRTDPMTCLSIRRNGFDCRQTCGVTSPIGLLFKRKERTSKGPLTWRPHEQADERSLTT